MKIKVLVILLFLLLSLNVFGENALPLSVSLTPGITFPIGGDNPDLYKMGFGGIVSMEYKLPILTLLYLDLSVGYNLTPIDVIPSEEQTSLSTIYGGINAGVNWQPLKSLSLFAYTGGGYFYGFLNDSVEDSGSNPYFTAGVGVHYNLVPSFSIGIEGAYRKFFGLSQDIMLFLGGTYYFTSKSSGSDKQPNPGLELLDIQYEPVFPVFYKYYDTNPIGYVQIKNISKKSIEDLKISLFVHQYMDNPKECLTINSLEPDEEVQVPLFALFNNSVLDISESTKVSINMIAESVVSGLHYENQFIQTVRLNDRNAITWDDDQKAAAFVTHKDPTILKFSKNVSGIIKDQINPSINSNFQMAGAVFETLRLYGINYQIDPTSAYAELSRNALMVDYLQFPVQTLDYRAGDCDDLSILYSALLEALGVETAFLTIPGHIFMAFSLGITPDRAKRIFNNDENLIFIGEKTWVPIEVTMLNDGFLPAWKTAVKEWHKNDDVRQTGFFPMHQSWSIYEPVGFSSNAMDLKFPGDTEIISAFQGVLTKFVDMEIYDREKQLLNRIQKNSNNIIAHNRLGVLYARFGLLEKAEKQFTVVLSIKEYTPALINLGTIAFIRNEIKGAKGYYLRAEKMDSQNKNIALSLARVYYELEDYTKSEEAYSRLKVIDPVLAGEFAYLDLKSSDTVRASNANRLVLPDMWEEE